MEKKNTSPTVAEQKQILETCVHKLEEVNACIMAMVKRIRGEKKDKNSPADCRAVILV